MEKRENLGTKRIATKAVDRRAIVGDLYKKGWSIREIAAELKVRLGAGSTTTVQSDIKVLLSEWREDRIQNTDDLVQFELARIETTVRILWDAWQKSCEDYKERSSKQKGELSSNGKEVDKTGNIADRTAIKTTGVEKTEKDITMFGDVRYIDQINKWLMERRKLLGLYKPSDPQIVIGGINIEKWIEDNAADVNAPVQSPDYSKENVDELLKKYTADPDADKDTGTV